MKITNYTKRNLKPGVTLIELTVVIVVILSLIAVLFVGATAYRNGASRSACIVKLRGMHVATRSLQNMWNGADEGEVKNLQGIGTDIETEIVKLNLFNLSPTEEQNGNIPVCPRDGEGYAGWGATAEYPVAGEVAFTCTTYDGANGAEMEEDHTFNP